jgi:hypothetical protein
MSFQSPGNETKRIVIPTEAGANATAQWRNLLSLTATMPI